jgi:hypothetical protein
MSWWLDCVNPHRSRSSRVRVEPPNKGMKLAKRVQLRSFAAYPRVRTEGPDLWRIGCGCSPQSPLQSSQ